ncbi:MAG: YIP1 family protein [Methanospirillaceae archaeon]|nr:YIP1 family protein [Methanospirillaceae archaeon]
MDLEKRITGLLFRPVDTYRALHDEEWTLSLKYYCLLLGIFTILEGIITGLILFPMGILTGIGEIIPIPLLFILILIFIFLANLICLFLMSGFMHIFVHLLGGTRGFFETLKVLANAATPSLLLGWIPLIGIIGWFWTLILNVTGIQELQHLSTPRALVAVIAPICIIFLIFIIVYIAFVFMFLIGAAAFGMDPVISGTGPMMQVID